MTGGLLHTVGTIVLAASVPIPAPTVFGSYEVWHTFVVGAERVLSLRCSFWLLVRPCPADSGPAEGEISAEVGNFECYSVAMASRTSSLAARLAGAAGGQDSGEGGHDGDDGELADGDAQDGGALVGGDEDPPEEQADAVPRAVPGSDHHRLPPHDRAQLTPGHPHRPQQSELPGAVQDRECQGVADAEESDDDREREQGIDESEEPVEGAVWRSGVPRLIENRLPPGTDRRPARWPRQPCRR